MPWGVAVGAVIGGAFNYAGASKAAGAMESSASEARRLQEYQYRQSRKDYEPWLQTGQRALQQMYKLEGMTAEERAAEVKKVPGYQFRLDEGLKSLQRSALAGSLTGSTYKGLMQYGQEYASDEYSKYYNRLASMAGLGQTAVSDISHLGAQSAAQQGGYLQSAGQARASGYLGQSNVIGSTLGQLASAYQQYPTNGGGTGNVSYYPGGQTSGYGGQNVPGDAYGPAYGGGY